MGTFLLLFEFSSNGELTAAPPGGLVAASHGATLTSRLAVLVTRVVYESRERLGCLYI